MVKIDGLEGWDEERIVASMNTDPHMWASLILTQDQTIKELNELLDKSTARLQLFLRSPDEKSH